MYSCVVRIVEYSNLVVFDHLGQFFHDADMSVPEFEGAVLGDLLMSLRSRNWSPQPRLLFGANTSARSVECLKMADIKI